MRKPLRPAIQYLFVTGAAAAILSGTYRTNAFANITPSPEDEARNIAKFLKPIPDGEWSLIAGAQASQNYEITKGDTLYDISKRLFGDARYWPKIWSLNNGSITNPHLIRPGNLIAFMPGTGTSLPSVSIHGTPGGTTGNSPILASASNAGHRPARATDGMPPRSREWQKLDRQSWESVSLELPPEIDPLGFDHRSKIQFHKPKGFDLEAIAASETIPFLGTITGSRSEGAYLSMGDMVYIEAEGSLQVGETYALTDEPARLASDHSDRRGYSYLLMGKVTIIGVKDGLFVGRLNTSRHLIYRGVKLIPLPARIPNLDPIPGPSPLDGTLVLDKAFSTSTTAQHKQVFVDRGTEDGVRPGMVFRAYQYYDPSNRKKVTESEFIIDADILIVQVSGQFSAGIVVSSLSPIQQDTPLVLLTEIDDLRKNKGFRERSPDEKSRDQELDDLDRMDSYNSGLGDEEAKELEQLENWKELDNEGKTRKEQKDEENLPDESGAPNIETLPEPLPLDSDQDQDLEQELDITPLVQPEQLPPAATGAEELPPPPTLDPDFSAPAPDDVTGLPDAGDGVILDNGEEVPVLIAPEETSGGASSANSDELDDLESF